MAAPKNPKPGKGKKSVSWREDPEILRRLAEVEDLALAGYRNTEIAKALKVSEATIRRDRDRLAELWREHTADSVQMMRNQSIANLRRLQRFADNEFRNEREKPAMLRLQLDAEREIIRLQGTQTPVAQPITFPEGVPPLEDLSSEALLARAAALEAVAQKLLAAKSENAGDDQASDETEA